MNLKLFSSKKFQRFTMHQGVRIVVGGISGVAASISFFVLYARDSIFLGLVFGIWAITSVISVAYGVLVIKNNRRSSGESEPIARTPDL